MTHPQAIPATEAVAPFYTPEEAGKVLRIGRSRIYDELRRCRLRSIKVGRSRRIPAEWLNDYRQLLIAEGNEEE